MKSKEDKYHIIPYHKEKKRNMLMLSAEVHSLVGEGSPDTLLLLYLDLLLLMVWTCSRTRCCADLSSRSSDGSARDVSSTSPMDRADFKGSGIVLAFVSTPETGEVQFVKLQLSAPSGCSAFDSQRDWPGPALLHAHITPFQHLFFCSSHSWLHQES